MSFANYLCLSGVSLFLGASLATADTVNYGSFRYESDLPHVLFLTGEININDSFELRRAMHDQTINMVVAASPGGNLYEGLQIAAILHDNKIATYVPEGASCESSCANIFLGGFRRLLMGQLGVHQFYSDGPNASASAPKDVATATTQYTTADIIGILNEFETPPFIYEKMLGTTDIYYLIGSEKARVNRGTDDANFLSELTEVDAYIARTPQALKRLPVFPDRLSVADPPPTLLPPTGLNSPEIRIEANALLTSFINDWSMENEQALLRIPRYYSETLGAFTGKSMSRYEKMVEKFQFALRWPVRDYKIEEGSVSVDCNAKGCLVISYIVWSTASPEQGKAASGRASLTLLLQASEGDFKIVDEIYYDFELGEIRL